MNQAENYRRAAETLQYRQFMLYKKTLRMIAYDFKSIDQLKEYSKITGVSLASVYASYITAVQKACVDALENNNKRMVVGLPCQ